MTVVKHENLKKTNKLSASAQGLSVSPFSLIFYQYALSSLTRMFFEIRLIILYDEICLIKES